MSPPPCYGGMASSSASRRPEHADAGRAEDLVAGEGVEIGAEGLHVDADVRHALRAVDEDQRAVGVRERR